MQNRTIVYGLGMIYEANRERIETLYNVVGYCDRDVSKIPNVGGMTCEQLCNLSVDSYDILLIATVPILVIPDLIENLGIPQEKIHVLFYDDVKRLEKHEMKFYGLCNEDAALICLVQMVWHGNFNIKYLEIGCNDPVHDNNSFNLYRLGARGVLVDPLPGLQDLVYWMRPEDKFFQVAVSEKSSDAKMTFYMSDAEQLGSLNEHHHEKFALKKAHNIKEIEVDVVGINDLIAQIGYTPECLLIDAEGEDEKILYGIDYSRYKPAIIMAEVCHGSGSAMEKFMRQRGYCVFMRVANSNTIFVLEKCIDEKFPL